MNSVLQPVRNRALSDDVAEVIRTAIFSGQYPPGTPLREMHLARELAVSQKTVRDALVKLERYGLVVRVPNTETIVSRHSKKDIRERLAIRTVLEEMACLEAARRATTEDFKTLEQGLKRLIAAAKSNNYFEAAQADLEFHRAIWRLAGNANLYEMLDHLVTPLMAFVSIWRSAQAEKLLDVLAPHDKLIEALRARKVSVIRELVREHTTSAYEEFLNSEEESLAALLQRGA